METTLKEKHEIWMEKAKKVVEKKIVDDFKKRING